MKDLFAKLSRTCLTMLHDIGELLLNRQVVKNLQFVPRQSVLEQLKQQAIKNRN
jgi:hypothetical protein